MPTWTELERRFLDLEAALRSARLDKKTGTEGEHWWLAAAFDLVAKSRFESLAQMAGRKLAQTFALDSLPEELRNAPSDQFLWYREISRNLRFYNPGPVAYPVNDKGEHVGWIATGSINNPAAVSAAHCLELAALTSEEENVASPLTVHVSGQNARFNVGSIDSSSNVITSNQGVVFEEARKAIAENIGGDAKDTLLTKLDELQKAANTPSYAARYREFIQTAADHVTVLGPVLAALATFLL
jgi:hypothetical protein